MGSKQTEEFKVVAIRCPVDLLRTVDEYATAAGLDRTKFLILALKIFVKVYRKRGRRITPLASRIFARPEINRIKQLIARKQAEKEEP